MREQWVDESEVDRVVDRFDVLVAPYVEASQSGVVPLAAALGVPSIVTPVGDLAGQVASGRAGIVTGAITAQAVADAMRRILDDRHLLAALRAGALAESSDRSSDRFGARLIDVMQELIAKGKRRVA